MNEKLKKLRAELAELEWDLDDENSNPPEDISWTISRKLKVMDQIEELEAALKK